MRISSQRRSSSSRLSNSRRLSQAVRAAMIEPLEGRVMLAVNSLVVNTPIDQIFDPGTGLISLRNAIEDANIDATTNGNPTIITFDPNIFDVRQTIYVGGKNTTWLLDDNTNVVGLDLTAGNTTIIGPSVGVSVVGPVLTNLVDTNDPTFSVESGVTASISNIDISGVSLSITGDKAAGSVSGGAIANYGNLTLTNVNIGNITISTVNGSVFGTGIYNAGNLTYNGGNITNCKGTANAAAIGNTTVLAAVAASSALGGGIYNSGNATISEVNVSSDSLTNTVTGNSSASSTATVTGFADGGGIYNSGNAALNNVSVDSDTTTITATLSATEKGTATGNGTALGGGISNELGNITLSNVLVNSNTNTGNMSVTETGNTAFAWGNGTAEGGDVYTSGNATMTNVAVDSGNSSQSVSVTGKFSIGFGDAYGGGLSNTATGNMTLTNGTVASNFNTLKFLTNIYDGLAAGGGMYSAGIARLANTTVGNNTLTYLYGGNGSGICNDFGGNMSLINSTVSGNTLVGGNLSGYGGGGVANADPAAGNFTVANSIVTANTVNNPGVDAFGAFDSLGDNLLGSEYGSTGWLPSDLAGTLASPLDPNLSALTAVVGGPTLFGNPFMQTMMPQVGSLAINHGSNTIAINYGLTTDQLGNPRIVDGIVDIGAVEVQGNLTLTGPAAQEANAGVSQSFNLGNFTQYLSTAPYTVDINWGDGLPDTMFIQAAAGNVAPQQHTYFATGNETGTITLTDSGPGNTQATATATFTVDVATITVTPPADQTANVGQLTTFNVGSFTQTNATGPYTVYVNWGDGPTDNIVTFANAGAIGNLTHTYATAGNYIGNITVLDAVNEMGNHTSNVATFNVDAAGITVATAAAQTANTGQNTLFNLGSFTQANATGPFTIDVNWGDATTDSIFALSNAGLLPQLQHNYAAAGNYSGNITVTDTANHTSNIAAFVVDVATITVAAPATQYANAGMPAMLTLGSFSQINATANYTAFINWGDGPVDTLIPVTAAGAIPAQTHTYATAGNETVNIVVMDGDNHSSTNYATFVVDVGNLTVTAPAIQDANTGQSTAFNLGYFQQFNATGPYTATVNWGDGTSGNITNLAAGAIPAQNHTYTTAGNFTGNITVLDAVNHTSNVASFMVDVATITVAPPANQNATVGLSQTFALGTFTQTNATAQYNIAVNWGDGTIYNFFTTNVAAAAASTVTIPATAHTYNNAINETVTITVSDSANHSSNSTTFTIAVGVVTVTPPANQIATAAETQVFNLGSFAQVNATAPYSVDVNWGDGSNDTVIPVAAAGVIPATAHTYAVQGSDIVTETVTDAAGRVSNSATFTVTVVPVPTVFTNLTASSTIAMGTAAVAFYGTITGDNGALIPPSTEDVAITIAGATYDAPIDARGDFEAVANTSQLPASNTPYQVTYSYAGDATFAAAIDNVTTKLTVQGVEEQVYRLYSTVTKEHLFTADVNEYSTLATYGWQQEGSVFQWWNGPITTNGVVAEPIYRLYDSVTRQHLWTTDANEYNTLKAFTGTWSGEGIAGYVFPTQVPTTDALYRLSYPSVAGLHVLTTSLNEYDTDANEGWIQEGVIGYVGWAI